MARRLDRSQKVVGFGASAAKLRRYVSQLAIRSALRRKRLGLAQGPLLHIARPAALRGLQDAKKFRGYFYREVAPFLAKNS